MGNQTIPHETVRPNNNAEVTKFTALAFLMAGIATAGIVAGIVYHPLWFAVCGASVAGSIMLAWRISEHDRRAFIVRKPVINEPPQPIVTNTPLWATIRIPTTRGTAVLQQPEAGALAQWLRTCLDDGNRIGFSLNEAKKRNFDESVHADNVSTLKDCGILHRTKTANGVPVFTANGKQIIRAWLEMK